MERLGAKEAENLKEQDLEEMKLGCRVYQESGTAPVTVSAVFPTFNNGSEEYIETMIMMMRKLGKLIDRGVLDEVVIVDGSKDPRGMPDYEFIKFMLALGIKRCKTFSNEVNFVRSLPEGKQKSLEGRFDFSIRFMSQLDPFLHSIFLKHRLLTRGEIEFLKRGKGAGLWYAIPVTYGDVIVFVDSDIKSFRKYYVCALCKPILDSWNSDPKTHKNKPRIVFSKGVYVRRRETKKGGKFGGRLERTGAAPLFRALSKSGLFKGLEEVKYHMSGECAFVVDALKDIQFSNGYDIETSVLCQVWKKFGMKHMAEVDLGVYQHIPGSEKHVRDMMEEVISALRYWTKEYGMRVDIKRLVEDYEEEARKEIGRYQKLGGSMEGFSYTAEDERRDLERIREFKEILIKRWKRNKKPKLLHSWGEMARRADMQKGYSYQNLKLSLRKRINKFTSNLILSSIYIDKSDDIIQRYSSVHRP